MFGHALCFHVLSRLSGPLCMYSCGAPAATVTSVDVTCCGPSYLIRFASCRMERLPNMFQQHPTIHGSLNDFVASVLTAGTSLVQAVVALFHLVLGFGHFSLDKFIQLAQTCIQLGFDLLRGVTGFIIANFFILLILGGAGYYWWSTRTQSGKRRRIKLRE